VGVLHAPTSPPKEGNAISNHTAVKLIQPGTFSGQLTAILRNQAQALLAMLLWAKCNSF
jgi:hypothetical protein